MCTEFIGRKEELKSLDDAYNSNTFQMCVLYGRRRVGKTTLINEFIKNKKSINYTAIKGNINRNIELLGKAVLDMFMPNIEGIKFDSIHDILQMITKNIDKERLIIFIDELPYLAENDSSFLSLLQSEIDRYWLNSKIFLILSGSSISFMEQEVLSSKSPIYGRRTMQINLKPFNYKDTAQFVPDYSYEEKALCYGITGGIAKYISMFNKDKSFDENIIDLYFKPSGFMYEEPHNLLIQEFKNASVYGDVINAIANGANKAVEIKDKTQLESASVHNVLDNLIETKIIKKVHCITEENNTKKIHYELTDGMFKFWYMFITKAIPLIEMDKGGEYYYAQVKPRLHSYMGEIFEDMCRQYLLINSFDGKFPCNIIEVGKWFGTNPQKKEQTDIDVVGIDTINNMAILGECKFRNTPIDKAILEDLLERDNLINKKYKTLAYILFSLSGFTKGIYEREQIDKNIICITLDKMYK